MLRWKCLAAAAAAVAAAFAAGADDEPVRADPDSWPQASPPPPDTVIEGRVAGLMARMTLEEKVGQTIQAELQSVTPDDIRKYHLGSVLNGGGSTPGGRRRAAASDWLELADDFWEASMDTSDGGVAIPVLWGTDAVHGHNNVYGATLFPHNIGLGAANDAELVRRIGEAVAREVRVTGQDWTFAPVVAVPQDDRWGRTYEGFSEDPEIVAKLGAAYVEGLQGKLDTTGFLDEGHVIATAKHFLGDGGTLNGQDQGDTLVDETALREIHAAGYYAAIDAGVQTVMASFSSWQGEKMHGRKDLLTDVLKDRMGFRGLVVGDWNGHSQVPGCSSVRCAAAYTAGVDMMMAPTDWRELYENTLAQVSSGRLSRERLDDAVRRILRVKVAAGLLDEPKPSERPYAGDLRVLGRQAHRALAREAVRRSLVLLKNNNDVLPLAPGQRVMVAGRGADDVARQAGGWTLSWQGGDAQRNDFPRATTIWEGIAEAVRRGGGVPTLSIDGSYSVRPDVAIVVFGETPYAEGVGDINSVAYSPIDETDLDLLRKLQADDITVVSVFLTGRPLWVNREINASDAFVVAWLPGSEGAGVADVLFEAPTGGIIYDFQAKLPYSWPKSAAQTPLNKGQVGYDPQFPIGYGLSYGDDGDVPSLPVDPGVDLTSVDSRAAYLVEGQPLRPWRLVTLGPDGQPVDEDVLSSEQGEGAEKLEWSGDGEATAAIRAFSPFDLSLFANAGMALEVRLRVERRPRGTVTLALGGPDREGVIDVTAALARADDDDWITIGAPLSCFAAAGADVSAVSRVMALKTSGRFEIELADVRLREGVAGDACPG